MTPELVGDLGAAEDDRVGPLGVLGEPLSTSSSVAMSSPAALGSGCARS